MLRGVRGGFRVRVDSKVLEMAVDHPWPLFRALDGAARLRFNG